MTAGQASGVVKIRLSGAAADVAAIAALLGQMQGSAVEVLDTSGSYPNRRDPGERVYLTVRVMGDRR